MTKYFPWLVIVIALVGAGLVAGTTNPVRLTGFCIWLFTNTYWMVHNWKKKDWPMVGQFFAFLGLAVLGACNNF